MIDMRTRRLKDIMPQNLLQDEKVLKLSEVLTDEINRIAVYAYKLNYTMNLRELPEEIIDHLLWENHLNRPEEGLILARSLEDKIRLLEASVELHRTKGTPHAIERALQAVGIKGDVIEWFEYNGEPYTFKILMSASGQIDLVSGDLRNLINAYKNVRSHFEFFEVKILEVVVEVTTKEYTFPVPYPVTGTFHTAPINGISSKARIEAESKSYTNSVLYPITGTFYCSEGGY